MKRKTILRLFALALVAASVAALYAYREYNRKKPDMADAKADFSLKGSILIKEFIADEKASNAKYLDKVIEITGTVKALDKDDNGMNTVVLGETSSMYAIRGSMDSAHNQEAAALSSGSTITLVGVCTGYNHDELLGSDLLLGRCAIKKL
jgi:hypothetical protein